MKKKYLVISLLLSFSLIGCATTVKDLKDNPTGTYKFTTNQNYQNVYRNAIQHLDNRTFAASVKYRMYSDIKEATLYIVGQPSGPFRDVYTVCELEAIGKNKTSVDIYYNYASHKKTALSLKESILSNETN